MANNFSLNSGINDDIQQNIDLKLKLDHSPRIKIKDALPNIKSALPRIKVNESNLFFDIDGEDVSIDTVADEIGNLFFNS